MRPPPAKFRLLFVLAVSAILAISTPRALADKATGGKPTLPSTRTRRLILTPAILRFGKVAIGQRSARSITLTNASDSDITLLRVTIQGRDFTLRGLDLPLTLASGERFTFNGVFAPRSHGDISETVSFVSDPSSMVNPILMLQVAGTGTDGGQLAVNPALMDFGTVSIGSFATQSGTLTASGEPVTISSANSSSSEFTFSGLTFPLTIPAGGVQEYTVTFTPQNDSAVLAGLSFFSDASDSPTVQSLTGIGAVGHTVDLSWNASTSQDVIGYNLYRGTTSGGPYQKINPVLDPTTVYTDNTVGDGNTYYYVATAVNSSDQESVYSNEAQAVIPVGHSGSSKSARSPAFKQNVARR